MKDDENKKIPLNKLFGHNTFYLKNFTTQMNESFKRNFEHDLNI
jgi:hypothetical protein